MPKNFVDFSLNFEPTCVSDMSFMNRFNPVEICLLVDVLNTINLVLLGFRDNRFAQKQSYSFFFFISCLLSRIICPCCGLAYKVKYHPQKRVYYIIHIQ